MSIRHQPVEFLVSIADRQTSLIKDDDDMMKGLLDLVVKLMIDIDQEVDEDWLNPKPGFKLSEEMEEDSVVFGLECIARIFHSAGEEKVLTPLLSLVENLLKNEEDWRFKNAGLHILSQIGDFVDDLSIIQGTIEQVINHIDHDHPKIKHASLHVVGQLSVDLREKFTEKYHEYLIPKVIHRISDSSIIRV